MNRSFRAFATLTLFAFASLAAADENPHSKNASPQIDPGIDREALVAKISDRLGEGVAAVGTTTGDAKLLDVVILLRSFGYGIIDKSESPQRASRGQGNRGRGGQAGNRGGGQGAPADEAAARQRFDAQDRDRDGVWKGDEINAYMSSHPASNDGEVTFKEFQIAWQEIRSGRGRGGGGSHRHGGGHDHGGARGGRPTAEQRASEDAKFVISLDVDRNRVLTVDEIRNAVADDVQTTLSPKPNAGAPSEKSTEAVPLSPRQMQRAGDRMLSRALAIRAVLILSKQVGGSDSIDQTMFAAVLDDREVASQLWTRLAGDAKTLATRSVYPGLVRCPRDWLELIR